MSLGRGRDRSRARGGAVAASDAIAALAPTERFRADSLAASPVASWPSTGSGAHAAAQGTGANQFSWSASSASFGNRAVVSAADAARQMVAGTSAQFNYLHDGTGCTVLYVGRTTSLGTLQYMVCTQGSVTIQTGALLYLAAGGGLHWVVGNAGTTPVDLTAGVALTNNTPFVCVVRMASAQTPDVDVRLNRAQVASGDAASALASGNATTGLTLSGAATPIAGWIGDTAEVVVWNRYLSAGEVTAAEAYVLARYGV